MSAERPLRVLLVPSAYYPHVGGIEEITRQLAVYLGERGHAVSILTNRWPDGTPAASTHDGVAVRRPRLDLPAGNARALARFAFRAPLAAAQIAGIVRRERPHAIHVIGAGPNAAYFAALRPVLRTPLVFTAQGEFRNDATGAFDGSISLRFGLRQILRHADAVTACSQDVLGDLERTFRVGARGEVVPNAIDPAEFELAARPPNGLGRYVFTAARLVEQKGIDTLIHAFAVARGRLHGRRLVIGGDGPERARLERLAETLGVRAHVSFLGSLPRPELARALVDADAYALPSRREAFGIALLEAMAAGVPALAARTGGIPEFARDGENALLVPVDDVGATATALERIVGDRSLRERLTEHGRRTADELAWERIAPRYVEIYRRVARV